MIRCCILIFQFKFNYVAIVVQTIYSFLKIIGFNQVTYWAKTTTYLNLVEKPKIKYLKRTLRKIFHYYYCCRFLPNQSYKFLIKKKKKKISHSHLKDFWLFLLLSSFIMLLIPKTTYV